MTQISTPMAVENDPLHGQADSVLAARVRVGDGRFSVMIKDTIDLAGAVSAAGSAALISEKPAYSNARIVENLLDSNCSIIGKTNLHELAYGVTGINDWSGTPRNPHYPTLIPGGSSSGSAVAVSAGMCDFSIGTDTGGSIRIPAACCGIFGLKPTFGRISRAGCAPKVSSLDCVGPFARDAGMLYKAMQCIDPEFSPLPPIAQIRFGWLETAAEEAVAKMVRRSVEDAFGSIHEGIALDAFDDANRAGLTIIARETHNAFGHLISTGKLGADIAHRLTKAGQVSDDQLVQAERVRGEFTAELNEALEAVDIVALPTLAGLPPRLEDAGDLMKMLALTALCRPFNVSGHPALSVPVGEIDGAPVSLQLVGRKGEDETLIAAAQKFAPLHTSKINTVQS